MSTTQKVERGSSQYGVMQNNYDRQLEEILMTEPREKWKKEIDELKTTYLEMGLDPVHL